MERLIHLVIEQRVKGDRVEEHIIRAYVDRPVADRIADLHRTALHLKGERVFGKSDVGLDGWTADCVVRTTSLIDDEPSAQTADLVALLVAGMSPR